MKLGIHLAKGYCEMTPKWSVNAMVYYWVYDISDITNKYNLHNLRFAPPIIMGI